MIVNPFSLHGIHVGIIRMLDPENSVDAVTAADSSLGSVQRVGSAVGAIAVLRVRRCHLR